jgi:hypothetical protein
VKKLFALGLYAGGLCGLGCGDVSTTPDTGITLFDAATPDAPAPPDAPWPDAFVCTETECGSECVDLTSAHEHCSECFKPCTPAQDCLASLCECPAATLVPETIAPLFEQMDAEMAAPSVVGIAIYTAGGFTELLVVGFLPGVTPVGTDIDLATSEDAFVLVGYDVDPFAMTVRGGYAATSGTLHLSRACAEGVAGSLTGVTFAEAGLMSGMLVPGGCTFDVAMTTFDIGADCPIVTPDAGPAPIDAGPAPSP